MEEDTFLLGKASGTKGINKWKLLFLTCFFAALLIGFYILHNRLYTASSTHSKIKILSLNVWGLPVELGSLDKQERIQKIVDTFYANPEFDIIFLQELWMPGDHDIISRGLAGKYIMTEYEDMNPCIPMSAPWRCSGLAVLSKYPFQETEFHAYNVSGRPSKDFIDGEDLVNKGVGRVRIRLPGLNASADFFVTHTIADAPEGKNYTNDNARLDQIGELMLNGVNLSKADLVVLAGDINTAPASKPFSLILRFMTNTALDILKVMSALFDPALSTYANPQNSWSANIQKPVMFDYIFYKTNNPNLLAWTNTFKVPIFHFKNEFGKNTSLSDHEGVSSTLYYEMAK